MSAAERPKENRLKAQCECSAPNCVATGAPLKSLGGHRKGCVCKDHSSGRPVAKAPIRAKVDPAKRKSTGRLKEGSAAHLAERQKVTERSGGLCEGRVVLQCETTAQRATEKHHVVMRSRGGSDYAENLLDLCSACHQWVTTHPKDAAIKGLVKHSWEADPRHLKPVPSVVKTAPRSAVNALVLQSMTEKDFQQWVVDLATVLGFHCYHTYDSRRSAPGFPDLVLTKNGRLIFAELKREKGKVTPEQTQWLNALGVVCEQNETVEKYLWRPSDAPQIEEVLQRAA
jgi:hypothetical protein